MQIRNWKLFVFYVCSSDWQFDLSCHGLLQCFLRTVHLKRNRGIQETDWLIFYWMKKTFENIHIPTSLIVHIPLDAIWYCTFSILMKWLQPGLYMILDWLFFLVSCCRLQWLTWIFLLVFKLVKVRRCDVQKLALSVFSYASSRNLYISI